MDGHALYLGRVMHSRLRPFRHAFRYAVYSVLLDLDRLDRLPRVMGHNRFNLFGFHDRDHGPRDGSPLRPWVEGMLEARGIRIAGGRIQVLCFPRVLGFVFNPITLYFCHGADGRLAAMLYEVKNTFGDQHCYVCPVGSGDGPADATVSHDHAKEFHVSPFIGMDGGYRFRLTPPGDDLSFLIRQGDADGDLLVASLTARRAPLTDGGLLRAFLTHPLLTLKVVGAIHWEALKLWRKGARFHRRPDPPVRPATATRWKDEMHATESAT